MTGAAAWSFQPSPKANTSQEPEENSTLTGLVTLSRRASFLNVGSSNFELSYCDTLRDFAKVILDDPCSPEVRCGTFRFMPMDRGIRLIAYFKFFKGILLCISGFGLLRLLHKDLADVVIHWLNTLHVDPDNRHFHKLLLKASVIDERQLKELSIGSFFYAGLLLTEGSALLLQKRWAKYFTLIITASFIPLELWELHRSFSLIKTAVIAANAAIVWYLAAQIKIDRIPKS
jgi:uncharacterized membrane protein (DUF2068 family)